MARDASQVHLGISISCQVMQMHLLRLVYLARNKALVHKSLGVVIPRCRRRQNGAQTRQTEEQTSGTWSRHTGCWAFTAVSVNISVNAQCLRSSSKDNTFPWNGEKRIQKRFPCCVLLVHLVIKQRWCWNLIPEWFINPALPLLLQENPAHWKQQQRAEERHCERTPKPWQLYQLVWGTT